MRDADAGVHEEGSSLRFSVAEHSRALLAITIGRRRCGDENSHSHTLGRGRTACARISPTELHLLFRALHVPAMLMREDTSAARCHICVVNWPLRRLLQPEAWLPSPLEQCTSTGLQQTLDTLLEPAAVATMESFLQQNRMVRLVRSWTRLILLNLWPHTD